jgi:hypothetical protein
MDAILANGPGFAEQQHFYDFDPLVWFIHFRDDCDPIVFAHAVHNVVKVTATALPQATPTNPTTPSTRSDCAGSFTATARRSAAMA